MIVQLVEKKFETNESIAMIDIEQEDKDTMKKIYIDSPVYKEITGEYQPWKFSEDGIIWAKKASNNSSIIILMHSTVFDNYNNTEEQTILYRLDPTLSTSILQKIVKCRTYQKRGNTVSTWSVQDPHTLIWNNTTSIQYYEK